MAVGPYGLANKSKSFLSTIRKCGILLSSDKSSKNGQEFFHFIKISIYIRHTTAGLNIITSSVVI